MPHNLTDIINEKMLEYKDNMIKLWKVVVTKETTIPLRWKPPDNPWVTHNIDGDVKESQKLVVVVSSEMIRLTG